MNYQDTKLTFSLLKLLKKRSTPLNPDLYGQWYSQLYAPYGDTTNWNVKTLHTLEQLILDYTN
jgi:hypothetical protein